MSEGEEAHFVLDKSVAKKQVEVLEAEGLVVSYSYKTNHEVGDVLQESCPHVFFSIHAQKEIPMIKDKKKIIFFTQAESVSELIDLLNQGIVSFVVDNEIDLSRLLEAVSEVKKKINVSLRMKFQEHRIGTGKYFVYGMPSRKVNDLIGSIKDHEYIDEIGVHIHRKSQNTSEWEMQGELEDSLSKESLERINTINLGGGLPSNYKSYTTNVLPYIFEKIKKVTSFLSDHGIRAVIEPGRFIAAPSIELKAKIIQVQGQNLILNTTVYNCALDTHLTGTKMLVAEELDDSQDGEYYLLKGNSPTRDDIFRYKVKLQDPKVGDVITFLNAGAYNYTTDFFGYTKLATIEK